MKHFELLESRCTPTGLPTIDVTIGLTDGVPSSIEVREAGIQQTIEIDLIETVNGGANGPVSSHATLNFNPSGATLNAAAPVGSSGNQPAAAAAATLHAAAVDHLFSVPTNLGPHAWHH